MSVVIEPARVGDAGVVAQVHLAGMTAGYRGRVPDRVLAARSDRPRARTWEKWLGRARSTTLVARTDAAIVGFCTLQPVPSRDAEGALGEIPVMVVHPAHWRLGIGRALCDRALAEASRLDFTEVQLWVLETNNRARKFYESLGFRADGETRLFWEGSDGRWDELRYRRSVG